METNHKCRQLCGINAGVGWITVVTPTVPGGVGTNSSGKANVEKRTHPGFWVHTARRPLLLTASNSVVQLVLILQSLSPSATSHSRCSIRIWGSLSWLCLLSSQWWLTPLGHGSYPYGQRTVAVAIWTTSEGWCLQRKLRRSCSLPAWRAAYPFIWNTDPRFWLVLHLTEE